MLQALDVLIGFSLVMLIMSMAVTMLTQLIGTWLFDLKGRALRVVISRLLTILDRGLKPIDAWQITDHILHDPLIARANVIGTKQALATVVHREELVKLILDFASDGDATKASEPAGDSSAQAALKRLQHIMRGSLKRNGIDDPARVLDAIRTTSLELEKAHPELATSTRVAKAIINHATSDFLAKINSWFDQTIDRASDLFTVRIRMVTVGVSIFVALLFQLNSFELINRLSVDDELRNKVVAAAIDRSNKQFEALPPPAAGKAPTIRQAIDQSGADQLEEFGLIAFPESAKQWTKGWSAETWPLQLLGIILSSALLSLGAPFWYSLMANFVKLRSVIASKDDRERTERQTSQVAGSTVRLLPPP